MFKDNCHFQPLSLSAKEHFMIGLGRVTFDLYEINEINLTLMPSEMAKRVGRTEGQIRLNARLARI